MAVERELRVNDQAEGLHELPGVVRADEHAALVLADDRERHAEQRLRLLEEHNVPHAQRRLRTPHIQAYEHTDRVYEYTRTLNSVF